jgi:hypothetical protein
LYERAQQKGRFQPITANTKKYRNRTDKDGDTIMTGKVQEKSRDRKTRGKNHDGLSKEERQKRYDSKACLRCGEVGHFRRDCPKNETRQAVVKIKMLKARTTMEDLSDTLSDLDLYEEARLADSTEYIVIPELVKTNEIMKWEVPQGNEWAVDTTDARQWLAQGCCWTCGDPTHQASECHARRGRIVIKGPNAEEVVKDAFQGQPYFTDPTLAPRQFAEDHDRNERHHANTLWTDCTREHCSQHQHEKYQSQVNAEDLCHLYLGIEECLDDQCRQHSKREKEHRRLHWVDCKSIKFCQYHAAEKERSQYDPDDCCHAHFGPKDCKVVCCYIHTPENREGHESLPWHRCKEGFCTYHRDAKEQCKIDENDPTHEDLWADECPILDCKIHADAHKEAHERESWITCIEKCRFHREQRIAARQENHHLHNTIASKECRSLGCKMHGTKRIALPDKLDDMIPHENLHWSFCTDDHCMVHRSSKDDNGYFPRKKKGGRLGGRRESKN